MSDDEYQVTSEIYEPPSSSEENDKPSKNSLSSGNVVTKFYYKSAIMVDGDGDLIVARRNEDRNENNVIAIEHSPSSTLQLVGRQVWRGALLLADFLMSGGAELIGGQVVMEMGAGVGLTSIVAAMYATQVVCTDVDMGGILDLIRSNAARNAHHMSASFRVMELDFFADSWAADLEDQLSRVSVVLAADVIYNNDLTDGFVRSLMKILSRPPKKTVYFALEKRFVFTVADLDSVAPCYEHFWNCLERARAAQPALSLSLSQLTTDFPQHFHYDRVKQLVLWQISS